MFFFIIYSSISLLLTAIGIIITRTEVKPAIQ